MIDTVLSYIGQPVSLLGAWLLVMPLYVVAIVALTTPGDSEPDEAEPAEWPEDEWPEDDEAETALLSVAPATQPLVAITARSFRLGDDEFTFRFRADTKVDA